MKIKKEALVGIVVLVVFLTAIVIIVVNKQIGDRNALASRISGLGRGGPPETIEGLRKAIKLYEDRIEKHLKDVAQTGIYWKILAVRLQDKGLYGEALEALEQAISYTPGDPTLQYMTGISAAMIAKASLDFAGTGRNERDRYYDLSEQAYQSAIAMDDRYAKPLYSLGVLYVFELSRPAEAIPYLERYLDLMPNDVDGMFVLAAAFYLTKKYEQALGIYDNIISKTKDADKRLEAQRNRQRVLEDYYG
jgi:tetratricopeptide (TPR) repeat protein